MTDLFDATLIPDGVKTGLPAGMTLRPLRSTDYDIGYDSILSVLSQDPLSKEAFDATFKSMSQTKFYHVLVLSFRPPEGDGERIVGTATLLVEAKFLRGGSLAGHVEDVAISPAHQGKSLGSVLIRACTALAHSLGCYKIILDCSTHNVPFYVKCGFEEQGVEMKKYL